MPKATIEEEIARVIDEAVNYYGAGDYPATAEFVEALSPLLNRVRAEALREAAEAYESDKNGPYFPKIVGDWLRNHADRIEQNSEGKS